MVRKIRFRRSHCHLEKKEPEGSLRGEDHVEFVLAKLAPDCQHRFADRAEEGQIGVIERGKEGRGRSWSSPIRHGVLNGWGHLRMSFGNAIKGERSMQRSVELV